MEEGFRKQRGIMRGTPVLTKNGTALVEELKAGDLVLTHKMRWQKVSSVSAHKTNNYCYVVVSGWPSVTVEEGCLFYVRKKTQGGGYGEPYWAGADSLEKGDLCAFPFQSSGKNFVSWYNFENCSPAMAVAEEMFYEVSVGNDDSLTANGIVIRCG